MFSHKINNMPGVTLMEICADSVVTLCYKKEKLEILIRDQKIKKSSETRE